MALDGRVYRLVDSPANVYLLVDDEVTLIDAGTPGDAKPIRDGIRALELAVADVDRVLLTHYDYDHVGALASLGLDAPIHVGTPDASHLTGADEPPLANKKGLFQRLTGRFLDRPDLPVYPIVDGERLGGFTAYHTPGHTPGHTSYLHEEFGVFFLGDCVRESDGELRPSPTMLCADADRNRESVLNLAERAPSFAVAAPDHGDPIAEAGDAALQRLASELRREQKREQE